MGPSESGFHNQDIGRNGFTALGREAGTQLEIPRVKERLATLVDQCHCAAQHVAGGQQGEIEFPVQVLEVARFTEVKNVFLANSRQAGLHQPGRRCGEDDLAMAAGVVGVGVADKYPLRSDAAPVWVKPKPQFRQVQITVSELDPDSRHRSK